MTDQPGFRINGRTVFPATGSIEGPLGEKHLEPRVMDLLTYLAHSDGRVVSREAIIRDVWRGTLVTDDVITRSISQIRRVLADDWRTHPIIRTIPKRGYQLAAAVEFTQTPPTPAPAHDPSPALPPPRDVPSPLPPGHGRARKKLSWVAGAALSLTLAASVAVLHWSSSPRVTTNAQPSVLVAPFRSIGSTRLGEDLSTELIDALSYAPQLRVIGNNTSEQLALMGKPALQAARDFGVTSVITGTVRFDQSRTHVSFEMQDAESGRVLHHRDYEFDGDPGFARTRIAPEVASLLGVPLSAPPPPQGAQVAPEAHQLLLEARTYVSKNQAGALQQACEFLQQAIQLAPDYADAHAALAVALMLQVDFGNRSVREQALLAQPRIDRALALNPKLATAYAAQGLLYLYSGQLDQAEAALMQATALRPNYAQAHNWLGLVAQYRGQIERSIAAFERSLEIEPLSSIAALNLSRSLDLNGHLERAEAQARAAIRLHPQFVNLRWSLGHILWGRGALEEARADFLQAIEGGVNFAALYGQLALLEIDRGTADRAPEWILRGKRIDPYEDMVWLSQVMTVLVSAQPLSEFEYTDVADDPAALAYRAAAQGSIAFYRGDAVAAVGLFKQARSRMDLSRLMNSPWLIMAGHAPALDEAAAYLRSGDSQTGHRLLTRFDGELTALRAAGYDSPGMDYEEAAVRQLSGDSSTAAVKLQTARGRGWREDWYRRLDPKFAMSQRPH